jgi:hypothetical protein
MKEFGKQAYEDTIYINFDSNARMAAIQMIEKLVKLILWLIQE